MFPPFSMWANNYFRRLTLSFHIKLFFLTFSSFSPREGQGARIDPPPSLVFRPCAVCPCPLCVLFSLLFSFLPMAHSLSGRFRQGGPGGSLPFAPLPRDFLSPLGPVPGLEFFSNVAMLLCEMFHISLFPLPPLFLFSPFRI